MTLSSNPTLSRLNEVTRIIRGVHTNPVPGATVTATPARSYPTMTTFRDGTKIPPDWHKGPEDSFHGKITANGPFKPEKDRYHLYVGLFCPFAHRANFQRLYKQLDKYAGIDVSIVKPYPKDFPDTPSYPGWRFNHPDEAKEPGGANYDGATKDKLFGSRYMNQIYFKADPEYKGKYSVPVLWDKKLETIVNNESDELLRDLNTAFNSLLPDDVAQLNLYPTELQKQIDSMEKWIQAHLNTGVYKAGFAKDQEGYDANVLQPFAALNKLEKIAQQSGGPYILGKQMSEIDVRVYATLIRFDTVYVQHFKCNLGMIRYNYPTLNNWLKHMYWDHEAYKNSTNFRHIKENYTKSHYDVNPHAITPRGPYPDIEKGFEKDWSKVKQGGIDMPEVLQWEKKMG
ncbi:glutathione S-transferase [Teratosphaeria nubilosa]|uniref:Glutathione S-transferase n=1 Tax=Teratosphaeria nubilosa TaxID=161662 RepID=A0A6G1L5V7_9PEZI|nr:glutathione S-transferase [Teratosphaeria nubilosa]